MNEICSGDENHVVLNVYDEPDSHNHPPSAKNKDSEMVFSIPFIHKVMYVCIYMYILEGLYLSREVLKAAIHYTLTVDRILSIIEGLIDYMMEGFSRKNHCPSTVCCAAVVVNTNNDKVLTNPGIAIVWGLAVPFYISAQVVGSTMAAGTLRLLFNGPDDVFSGTTPQGSDLQAFVIEFIITFYLMFVVSGVATDNRAIGELAGLAIGSTVLLNVLIAGPITGASMNPARSLGPAIVSNHYEGIWIYVTSPIIGAVSGAWVYNMMRLNDKRDITKNVSIFKS
ncbi:hypothetical protein Gohar_003515 [Gossypium harknessii]|uniref:Uncharacterized protein n=1 Tax=Gossypium harknessii TaxID=34285 RepID=A0A7J9HPS4_9ROSI|nr:hypothetical protein [Gossypium harknessii]